MEKILVRVREQSSTADEGFISNGYNSMKIHTALKLIKYPLKAREGHDGDRGLHVPYDQRQDFLSWQESGCCYSGILPRGCGRIETKDGLQT